MQLHLEGSNAMNAPGPRVYSLLTDPNFVAGTLPDAEDVHVLDGSSLEAKIKLRIAVVSSTLKMKMVIQRTAPPNRATLVAEGTGSGSAMKITSVFELSGEASTTMRWSADAEITGVMAGIGSTLLKGFASKKVSEIFTGITKAVEAAV
ncbi:MAG TPA: SRPBCC domain-containing protein [Nitrososphaerales archaeon]|nr:SRPBCC domain-containing protein [Nitrososphaerales archaeon]